MGWLGVARRDEEGVVTGAVCGPDMLIRVGDVKAQSIPGKLASARVGCTLQDSVAVSKGLSCLVAEGAHTATRLGDAPTPVHDSRLSQSRYLSSELSHPAYDIPMTMVKSVAAGGASDVSTA